MKYLVLVIAFLFLSPESFGQAIPSKEENIPHLVTFGRYAADSWGDDDKTQIFFFVVPKSQKAPIYIRIFDPEVGGELDEKKGEFNTKTEFSVYGGKGCISNKNARDVEPRGDYKSGNLLGSKTFGSETTYDQSWYAFGPFDPSAGEFNEKYGGYVFKVIAQGISGDDGNLYNYFLSIEKDKNKPVEGGNAFTFEYTFRLPASSKQISHVYPYINQKVMSVKQSNFDWDDDGHIRVVSKAKKGELFKTSGDNKWASSTHQILEEEYNSSMDVQFIKSSEDLETNNVVFYLTDQYGEYLPFYSIPIGGTPNYKYNIGVR